MKLTFVEAFHGPEAFKRSHWIAQGLTKTQAKTTVEGFQRERVYQSTCGTYQVNVDETTFAPYVWLSIKRRDREPLGDWRVKQAIKNAIVGEEREAVELYPAESRLVDTCNQYHLYVVPEGKQFDFGWTERLVHDAGEGPVLGSKQRPFAKETV